MSVAHIDDARLQDIEERLVELYKDVTGFNADRPNRSVGSINDLFLGRDVPWLISRVRQLARVQTDGNA